MRRWLGCARGLNNQVSSCRIKLSREELGDRANVGPLSGPSFAIEVACGLPTALTVAGAPEFCERVTEALHGGALRIYSTDDVAGVEVGGAVKNVMAIATGISDALELGLNARAALITRGLAEITRFGVALGARAETFTGLTGIGDLILTATGDLSRNRKVGLALGRGATMEAAVADLGHVAEGVRSAHAVLTRARQFDVDMPITEAVCAVLDGALTPSEALHALLAREPKVEVQLLIRDTARRLRVLRLAARPAGRVCGGGARHGALARAKRDRARVRRWARRTHGRAWRTKRLGTAVA